MQLLAEAFTLPTSRSTGWWMRMSSFTTAETAQLST